MTFSRLQMLFVLLLFIGISNHVLIVPHLLGYAKRDAWICVIFSYIILLLWIGLFSLIFSKNKQRKPLHIWLRLKTGQTISKFILSLFFLYFLVIGFFSFFDVIVSVIIYFLPYTPTWLVALPFLIMCVWAASSSLKTIVYTSAVVLPIVWLLGHFVAITTMENKDYSYLFPLFADPDASILKGTIIVLGGSVDLFVLFLLQQYYKKPLSYGYLVLLVTLLMGLVLGPTIGNITAFGPEVASDLRFPAFEQWRLITIGGHFSHVDALAVFQLLCGVVIRVSLCLYLLPDLLGFQKMKIRRRLIYSCAAIYAIVMFLHISDIQMQTLLKVYFYPFIFGFGIVMTLLLLFISYFPEKKGSKAYEAN